VPLHLMNMTERHCAIGYHSCESVVTLEAENAKLRADLEHQKKMATGYYGEAQKGWMNFRAAELENKELRKLLLEGLDYCGLDPLPQEARDMEAWRTKVRATEKPKAEAVVVAETFPPKSCNRHSDCRAADAKYTAQHGEAPGFNFHCFSEDCEDCFGK
jgi:hypothetical protein